MPLRIPFFLLFTFITTNAVSQSFDKSYVPELPRNDEGKVTYSEVVQVPGISKEQLYFRARAWFSNAFKSAKDVIQMDSKEAGTIIGKGNSTTIIVSIGIPLETPCHYTVKIFCKDGRFKCEVTDISYSGYVEGRRWENNIEYYFSERMFKKSGKPKSIPLQYMQQTEKVCKDVIASIKEKMQKEIGSTGSDDDW